MTDHSQLKNEITSRFNHMTVSLRLAQRAMGLATESLTFEQTEQGDARRKLLRVEKQAIRDKALNERSHINFVNSIREMLHLEITKRLEEKLRNPDHLYYHVLGFDSRLPELLDLLSVRASSISRIEPIAASMPWLYDELIRLINTPKYRRMDNKGKVVNVDSLRVALSYLGIENLKMIIPSIALRRSLPQITDPFPEIKTRIFDAAIGTAMSCKKLASISELDEYTCFMLGFLHDIGKAVIVRLFFILFDEVQREAIAEAQNERKRDEHSALLEIEPSDEYLMGIIEQYGYALSAELVHKMRFKRLFVAAPMQEFAQQKALNEMSPLAKLLTQAVAYNRYRTLKQHRMISVDEAKDFLSQFHFPKGALSVLKTTDLRELDINMDIF
ncbi:HDOD domain-containing protein [Aliiglaciecola litoralis]|uniref:HDOD domain-containing protein n=1 Tax=Aliiglaciecola litoralis TaxID=582857 RepID=A0ABP3X1C7_9ALTE